MKVFELLKSPARNTKANWSNTDQNTRKARYHKVNVRILDNRKVPPYFYQTDRHQHRHSGISTLFALHNEHRNERSNGPITVPLNFMPPFQVK